MTRQRMPNARSTPQSKTPSTHTYTIWVKNYVRESRNEIQHQLGHTPASISTQTTQETNPPLVSSPHKRKQNTPLPVLLQRAPYLPSIRNNKRNRKNNRDMRGNNIHFFDTSTRSNHLLFIYVLVSNHRVSFGIPYTLPPEIPCIAVYHRVIASPLYP